jgi:ABC-type bacteriocin/lantibiotic exporter with double-glycine peptidase domain
MSQRLSFAENKETAISAIKYLLGKLKVPVTTRTITETLQQHPDYPSLLSINDPLHRWKIDNICLRTDPEKLSELAPPLIAYFREEGGIFIIITDIKNDGITYMNPAQSPKPISKTRTDFLKIWNGVVLVAETNNQSGEKDYKLSRRKESLRQLIEFVKR